jgi:hypothetical protein
MHHKRTVRALSIAAQAVMICGILSTAAFAEDSNHEKKICSNETFKGDYGFTVTGVVLVSPGVTLPIQGVQLIHSDGKGNLTDTESLLVDGAPLAGADGLPLGQKPGYFSVHTGTYKLDGNCTGVANLTNGFNFVNLAIVADKQGKQIRMVVVPPFDSGNIPRNVTSLGERVEAPHDDEGR